MLDELLKIVKQCDRRGEWTDEEWKGILRNCILKNQYILKIKNKEIASFACWIFLRNLDKINNQFIESLNGTIAYIQCAYVKQGSNGLLRKMLKEGIEKHPDATHIFYCNDRLDNKKVLIPLKKWRNNEKTD